VSGASVLFDAPGPKTRVRHRIYTVIFLLLVAGALFWIYRKLDEAGQFEPLIFERLFSENVWRELRKALLGTLKAAAISIVTSLIVGFILAAGRLSDRAWVRVPCVAIVEFFRAVPLLLLIILFFFLVQQRADFERETNALLALVLGLTLYNGAVLAEVFRAGINAVPRGQSEAAYAIGMRKSQVMTMILTPQAVRFMLPAIISQCVVILKDTSLGFAATYTPELVSSARRIAQFVDSYLMTFLLVASIFIAINSVLSFLAYWLERRLATRGRGAQRAVAEVEGVLEAG
jgi:glutamate transport system permease protein